MSRPLKTGLDYFPLDCQMDNKIEALESEYGLQGFAIYIKILQEIYQTENGELIMNDGFSRWKMYGKRWELEGNILEKIIEYMATINLFDKEALKNGILTSSGIKKRLDKVNQDRRIDRERKLSDSFPTEKPRKRGESKVKESKVKESSSKRSQAPLTDTEFISTLKNNPAYLHVDIDTELGKMDAWLLTRPGRTKTRRFVVNWLNKISKPLGRQSGEPLIKPGHEL